MRENSERIINKLDNLRKQNVLNTESKKLIFAAMVEIAYLNSYLDSCRCEEKNGCFKTKDIAACDCKSTESTVCPVHGAKR